MEYISNIHIFHSVKDILSSGEEYFFPKSGTDGWINKLVLITPIIVAVIGFFQYRLSRGQYKLAKQQAGIAETQKKIAEDKHRLELFEKRFETYELFLNLAVSAHKLNPNRRKYEHDSHEIHDQRCYVTLIKDNEAKLITLGEGSRFLFGLEIKTVLDTARSHILGKVDSVEKLNKIIEDCKSETFIETITKKSPEEIVLENFISTNNKFLENFYKSELPNEMAPYLNMNPYLSENRRFEEL